MRYWRLKDKDCSYIKLSDVVSISKDYGYKEIKIVFQSGNVISYLYPSIHEAAFDKEYVDIYNELEKVGQQ